jgi:hypothetical protein
LLTRTTIIVNSTMVAAARLGRAIRWEDDAMAGTRKPKRSTLPLRSPAPARHSPRPAIALDVLNGHLGYFVRRLQVWVFQDFIRALASIDVSPAQFSVLVVAGANRGLSQAELSASLGIERARLVRLLHRLEERGLIQRLPSSAAARPRATRPRQDTGGTAPKEIDRKARRRTSSNDARRAARFLREFLVEHDLFGKPASTFPDHALTPPAFFRPRRQCGAACDPGRCAPRA